MNAACLLVATLLFGQQITMPELKGSPKRFIDFSDDLARPSVAVVMGSLSRITEGRRERMKDQDAELGEGEAKVTISGVVYNKVESTARLVVTEGFCGPAKASKGDRISIGFDLQVATLPDGNKKRHFMITPRTIAEDSQTGLWVIEKDKSKDEYKLLRLMRLDAKEPKSGDLDAFAKRAADVYDINKRMHDLKEALERAYELREKGDQRAAANLLKPLVEAKKTWRVVDSDALAAQYLGPLEKRARDLLAEVDKKS